MYNLVIYIYLIGVAILSIFNEKVRKMWQGERRAIADVKAKLDPQARYVWVHAASLGEFEQGRPIIESLRRSHPEYKILLTFFSPSGYEVRKNYEGADIICYLPLDTPLNARRFLRTIRPVCALFIKYEFWYNYLHILKHRGVPVYSVSSIFRPEQIFFRWYGHQYRHVLKCFTHFFVQNDVSKQLLHDKLHLDNVSITGDTRFDRVLDIAAQAKEIEVVERFLEKNKGKKVFIAGSSWLPDEEIFIPYFKEHTDWTLIIAPHVIAEDHLQQIESLLRKNNRTPIRFKEPDAGCLESANIEQSILNISSPRGGREGALGAALIINCFGLLSSIYRYADVTYVGGGFGVSIHNILEAAVWQKPVIFGPNNLKFKEAQDMKACGGGLEIVDAESFRKVMDTLRTNNDVLRSSALAAGDYVKGNSGAAKMVLDAIKLGIRSEG